ncbi:MAG: hypothetical protein AAF682_08280 [Planctomycetota bacterium]
MKDRVHLALIVLAVSLREGGLWPLDPMTAKALAAGLLSLSLLAHAFSAADSERSALRIQLGGMLLGVLVLGLAESAGLGILGVAAFAWARSVPPAEDAEGDRLGALRRLAAAPPSAVALAAFALLTELRLVGPVRLAYEGIAAAVSGVSNAVTGGTLELGATALGVDLAVLALLLIAAAAVGRGWKTGLLRTSLAAAGLFAVLLAYAIAFDAWIDATREFTREASEEGPEIFRGLFVLVPVLALAVVLGAASHERRVSVSPLWAPAAACAALAVLPLLLLGAKRPARLDESTVLLILTAETDDRFDGSPHASYGYYQSEGYRAFRSWLEAWGCDVRYSVEQELSPADFQGVDLAVYVTPARPSEGPVQSFIEGGGSVLYIGDHTPMLDALAELNDFLAPFDLSYEFDSVFPCRVAPGATLRTAGSPLGRAVEATPEVCFGVGASLRAGPAADVLLESRWAVGDLGFEDSASLLGNRHYDHGDRLSDLPVVVSGQHGAGKLVVVGDTGSFVDSALPFSYPFVHSVVEEALTSGVRSFGVSLLGLAALLAAAAYASRSLGPVAIAALGAGITLPGALAGTPNAAPLDASRAVAIDASLRPQTASLDRDPRTSLKGFAYQCSVNGWLPMVVNDLSAAVEAAPGLVVVVSPALEPDAALRSELRSYLQGGGELWVSVGHEEAGGSRTLLGELGLAVRPCPFGSSLQDGAPTGVRYREAWQVASAQGVRAEVLLAAFGLPIILRAESGAGHVTVFGDSYFLCDENVGTGEMTHEESEHLLSQLLARVQ